MHVVIADRLSDAATSVLASLEGWKISRLDGRPREELLAAMQDADALLVRSATKVDAELLGASPRLRIVARAGAGVDNVDLDAATRRGVLVTNAPGANSVSVAEHAFALMLALARSLAAADASMKQRRWEKRSLVGAELRGKVLGIVGLGRVGREVAQRGRAFGMTVLAHDPFVPEQAAADLGLTLLSLDDVISQADYITLHLPSSPSTRRLLDAARLAACKPGVVIVNTARGDLIDEPALLDALERGHVAGAGLDVFAVEPPKEWPLAAHAHVIATPHIAASTAEAQEQVAVEAAGSVRDYLLHGLVRNAVNFPSVPADEAARLRPFLTMAERAGDCLSQLMPGQVEAIGLRYYGALAERPTDLVTGAALVGLLRSSLTAGVTLVNARTVAAERGIEVIESRSTRQRSFTSLLSLKLHARQAERWIEATVFDDGSPRLVLLDGIEVEAPLEGTLLVIRNDDRPGVIGEIGAALARHGFNVARFALGRDGTGAVGVVNLDVAAERELDPSTLAEVRAVPGVREAIAIQL